jgi:OOP family OmpA-OmpF porin
MVSLANGIMAPRNRLFVEETKNAILARRASPFLPARCAGGTHPSRVVIRALVCSNPATQITTIRAPQKAPSIEEEIHERSKFRLASATLLMLASLGATAQSKDIVVDGQGEVPYVVDQRNVVARSGFDLCWRTGYWTPGAAGAVKAGELPVGCQCDKDVVGADTCAPPPVALPAPAAVAAAAPAAAAKCDFSVNLRPTAPSPSTRPPSPARQDHPRQRRDRQARQLRGRRHAHHHRPHRPPRLPGLQPEAVRKARRRRQAYLLAKGVKAANVETMGAGKTQPIKGCDDKLGRKKLIECLAPNRRVTVDVKGPAK